MPHRRWHESEVVGLLAWVDLCNKYQIDFKQTIVKHLKRVTEEHVGDNEEHSIGAIRNKLCHLRNKDGAYAGILNELKEKGPQCMSELTHAQTFAIQAAFNNYEEAWLRQDENMFPFLKSHQTTGERTPTGDHDLQKGKEG